LHFDTTLEFREIPRLRGIILGVVLVVVESDGVPNLRNISKLVIAVALSRSPGDESNRIIVDTSPAALG